MYTLIFKLRYMRTYEHTVYILVKAYVFDVFLKVVFTSDAVLPPLSSKVIKFLIDSGLFLPSLRELSLSRSKYKPLFISNLWRNPKERIYLRCGDNDSMLKVKSGEQLRCRVSFVTPRSPGHILEEISSSLSIKAKTPYGEVLIEVEYIESASLNSLSLNLSKSFIVLFMTPSLLSPKLGLPPVESIRKVYSGVNVGYVPFCPGLLYAYAMRLWGYLTSDPKTDLHSYKAFVIGNALTEVVNIRLIPETVIIGRDSRGNLRKARGFKGFIRARLKHSKLAKKLEGPMALISKLGVGRGRGIGLGEVRIALIETERQAAET